MDLTSGQPQARSYEIVIQGAHTDRWSSWFNGIRIRIESAEEQQPITILECPPIDQAKLRGIMNSIWDMNLSVLSLKQVQWVHH